MPLFGYFSSLCIWKEKERKRKRKYVVKHADLIISECFLRFPEANHQRYTGIDVGFLCLTREFCFY